MDYSKIKVAVEDGVAIITMADPTTMNAAGLELGGELAHAFKDLAAGNLAARAIVLTGEGRGFCSGANLSGGGPAARELDVDGKPDAGRALETLYNPLVTLMKNTPLPLVTAVNGAAAGIGCSFGLLGDLIVAGESAYFLQAFRRIGLVPDGGSTYLLPRMIGRARAMEMALMGDKISAAKALEWGMVNRVVPDAELLTTAVDLARQLANGPASLGHIRRLMWESLDNSWTEQLQAERQAQKIAGKTEDFIEGVSAFLEKRPTAFKGR
jgi:2-(1,2-epoxy-1,2-dihydrophenyl)acetyl-CoA isomerase